VRFKFFICGLCWTRDYRTIRPAEYSYHLNDDSLGERIDICKACKPEVEAAGYHVYRIQEEPMEVG